MPPPVVEGPPNAAELRSFLLLASKLVALYGDAYLPYVELFEAEYSMALRNDGSRARALRMAKSGEVDDDFYLTRYQAKK